MLVCTSDGRSVAERPCTAEGRVGVGAGGGVPLPRGGPGVLPRENFDILDARMCILELTQRRIGIVDKNKLLRLNTYGD